MASRPIRLALIDPGLRKAPFFLEFRHKLPDSVACVYYSRRQIVRGHIRSAGASLYPVLRSPLPPPDTRLDDAALQAAIGRRERTTSPARQQLARQLLAELEAFYDEHAVGAILVWNGSKMLLALAIHLARARGLPVIHAEHGYLPGTLQFDAEGVNCSASITRQAQAGLAALPADGVLDARLDALIAAHRGGQPLQRGDSRIPSRYNRLGFSGLQNRLITWGRQLRPLLEARLSRLLGMDRPDAMPERFVLLPMQVRRDSQLALHSPLLGNDLERFIASAREAVATVDPALKLVVKLHPLELVPAQRRNLGLRRRFPDVVFLWTTPIRELLPRAEAVLTINSTVGFEAFLYDRPVVTLGENFYTVAPLVCPVSRLEHLPAVLQQALAQPVNREARRAFLRYVCARLLVAGSYRDFSDASLQAVADRVATMLGVAAALPRPAPATAGLSHTLVQGLG